MVGKIFISHSSQDKVVAEAALAALEAQCIKCWIAPRDIVGGVEWGEAVMEALCECQIVVLIFSIHANNSPQVKREVERAVSRGKSIVPFRVEDVLPSGAMELALGNTHWMDAFSLPLERHLPELCEAVSRLIRMQAVIPFLSKPLPELHKAGPCWDDVLPSGLLWNNVESACRTSTGVHVSISPQSIGDNYQRRAIEDTFAEFVSSSAKGMFLVGDSGMGKTTLLIRLLTEYQSKGDLCAMFESSRLPTGLSQLETHLVKALCGASGAGWSGHPGAFWTLMDGECERRDKEQQEKKHLLVFIDAVNEFSPGKEDPRPIHLLDELDRIITDLNTPASRVKFVITCRPETWRRATDNAPTRFRTAPGTYFSPKSPRNDIQWTLPRFSDEEFKGAYEKYKTARNILTPFEDLSPVAVYHLKDPFLLNLAAQAFASREIPRDLETGSLFEHYFGELRESHLDGTIDEIVSEMFVGDDNGEVIQRTSFPRNSSLSSRNNSLYKDLDFSNDLLPGAKLKERNVIREWKLKSETGDQYVTNIRFTYDRFAEYLLSNRLYELILRREKSGEALPEAAKAIISGNLATSQHNPVVYRALQRTLFLLRKHSSSYVSVLRSISEIDARGQWLVISVLARTARKQSGGIELLADLLKELGKGRSSAGRRFPVIDSVYRVLRDEDYRLWLEEQDRPLKKAHFSVLYEHFVQAFHESDPAIWAVGVQYLFFLWKSGSTHAYSDAKRITRRLAKSMGPAVGMAFSGRKRRGFRSLAALMILVLAEAPADRFLDAVNASGAIIRRLRLKRLDIVASIFVDTFVLQFALKMMASLPNPVQLDSLTRYFENRDVELPIAEEVLELLAKDCDPSRISLETLKRLAHTEHSFTVQMLTFVVSVHYERAATDEDRAKALRLARDLFYEEPRSPIAEYCASLALYHINYFGSNATQESMDLMGRMADSILAERQGHLHLSGKRHNFNIIGTYGRALHKHGRAASGPSAPGPSAMQYVLNSLQLAKETQNPAFYSYICKEIGLLGVLVEPRYLFDVFTAILTDLRALDEHSYSDELPFQPDEVEKLTNTILQSLANIRVLYRQQVDKYLLEVLEKPEIYADVATKRDPEFQLSFFISWAFEQLMFRALVYYYDEMGKDLLQSFLDSMRCRSCAQCVRTVLSAVVRRCVKLSE
ncbi:MAG: TIR domain-containing protein [Terracidiphilus sp.]